VTGASPGNGGTMDNFGVHSEVGKLRKVMATDPSSASSG
jgi:arginine deiminase